MQIVFLIFDGLTPLDAVGPYEVLSRLPEVRTRIVAPRAGPVRTGKGSLSLIADEPYTRIEQADVLVIPGGPGVRPLLDDQDLLDWIARLHATTTWTTAVCTGSLLLAAAGLLQGHPATTHWGSVELLRTLGARPTKARVVKSGKIITAAGVSAGIDMALNLAMHLCGEERAKAIQLRIEYDPQPPFDCGHPDKADDTIKALARG